ncbi:MAG: hypothetical protein FWD25_08190 [Clostridia bacterium]|nr:hypothetical protein [Clostridia bacterium]
MQRRKILALFLVLAMALVAQGAVGESAPNPAGELIGAWQADWAATAVAGGDLIYGKPAFGMAFSADGKWTASENGEAYQTDVYTVSGDILTLYSEQDSSQVRFRAEGDTLTLYGGNERESMVFFRLGEPAGAPHVSAQALIGLWQADMDATNDILDSSPYSISFDPIWTMAFGADGAFTQIYDDEVATGEYTVSGKKITITNLTEEHIDDPEDPTRIIFFTFVGNDLWLEWEYGIIGTLFTRVLE